MSLPRTVAPSLGASPVSRDGEPIERAIAVEEATSDLDFLLDVNFCTSAGEGGIVVSDFGLRKRGIVMKADGRIGKIGSMVIAMAPTR